MLQAFFSHANWLAIATAAVTYFILGALWFSALFGKPWMAGHKISMPTDEAEKAKMKAQMPMLMIKTFLMNIIVALGIGLVVYATSTRDCMHGIKWGLLLSGFAAVPIAMNHMYLMKGIKLTMIDAGYHVVSITLMTIIITVWHH